MLSKSPEHYREDDTFKNFSVENKYDIIFENISKVDIIFFYNGDNDIIKLN